MNTLAATVSTVAPIALTTGLQLAGTRFSNRTVNPPAAASSTSSSTAQERATGNTASDDLAKQAEQQVRSTIVSPESLQSVRFADIVGLTTAKEQLRRAVVLPVRAPNLVGNLPLARGILLYGPPGTGKTFIAKAVAAETSAGSVKSTFFNVTAANILSKFVGEGERFVQALFRTAASLVTFNDKKQLTSMSIIFIDEIDNVLGKRGRGNPAADSVLNVFLQSMDGLDRPRGVFVLGATNHPWNLDEAALRRFASRIYIPLPQSSEQRLAILVKGLQRAGVSADTIRAEAFSTRLIDIASATKNYSPADLDNLVQTAAQQPLSYVSVDGDTCFETVDGEYEVRPPQECAILPLDEAHSLRRFDDSEIEPLERLPPVSVDNLNYAYSVTTSVVDVRSLRRFDTWTKEHGVRG